MAARSPRQALVSELAEAARAAGRMAAGHAELAMLEAATAWVRSPTVRRAAAGVALVAVGWMLLAAAFAIALGERIGPARGWLMVSAAHTFAGLYGLRRAGRLSRRRTQTNTTAAAAPQGAVPPERTV